MSQKRSNFYSAKVAGFSPSRRIKRTSEQINSTIVPFRPKKKRTTEGKRTRKGTSETDKQGRWQQETLAPISLVCPAPPTKPNQTSRASAIVRENTKPPPLDESRWHFQGVARRLHPLPSTHAFSGAGNSSPPLTVCPLCHKSTITEKKSRESPRVTSDWHFRCSTTRDDTMGRGHQR